MRTLTCNRMAVENLTGKETLFILLSALAVTVAYAGIKTFVQRRKWYAVDISLVLSAMTLGRKGTTGFLRTQQCVPPMPSKKAVYKYLDEW